MHLRVAFSEKRYSKSIYVSKRREVEFQVGDPVYLKLQPYRQSSLAQRPYQKLAARYYGPFEVIQRMGAVAYKLQLPPGCKLHPVFHVSQLKAAVGTAPISPTFPPQLTSDLVLQVRPAAVQGVRPKNGSQTPEVLIEWDGLQPFEATWEDYVVINKQFPEFHLEDKVALWGEGIAVHRDAPAINKRYVRRGK